MGNSEQNSADSVTPIGVQISNPTQTAAGPDEEKPFVIVEPTSGFRSLDLRSLWAYRELLYFLALRDIKVRYKQTLLGISWVVLQPLLMTAVFTVFLGHFARVPSGNTPYALVVFSGLLPWTFFSSAVTTSSNSLVGNAHLITKIYFPRMIIPIAAVAARLLDTAVSALLFFLLMAYYRTMPSWNCLMLPVLFVLLIVFALSVSMLTSALNVRYRDIGVVIPVLIQLLMFVSPVVYPLEIVPTKWLRPYLLNPLAGMVDSFRVALLGGQFRWGALAFAAITTFVAFVVSAFIFRSMERQFADVI